MANNTKQQDRLLGRDANPPCDKTLKAKFDADERRRNKAALERRRATRTGPPNNVGVEYARRMVTKGGENPFLVNSTAESNDSSSPKWTSRK